MTINWITKDEQEIYARIVYGDENVTLMRASLDGEEVAVVVAANLGDDSDDEHKISAEPLAVLINEAIFNRLQPPADPISAMVREEEDRGN